MRCKATTSTGARCGRLASESGKVDGMCAQHGGRTVRRGNEAADALIAERRSWQTERDRIALHVYRMLARGHTPRDVERAVRKISMHQSAFPHSTKVCAAKA